jgi:hypothetical protein
MRSLMASCPDRSEGYELAPALTIMVNRPVTRFAAWYEFFPRSQGTMPYRHGTLQDSIRACPRSRRWASTSSICRRFTRSATASAKARTTAWSP